MFLFSLPAQPLKLSDIKQIKPDDDGHWVLSFHARAYIADRFRLHMEHALFSTLLWVSNHAMNIKQTIIKNNVFLSQKILVSQKA